jgi:hypothetical protein
LSVLAIVPSASGASQLVTRLHLQTRDASAWNNHYEVDFSGNLAAMVGNIERMQDKPSSRPGIVAKAYE